MQFKPARIAHTSAVLATSSGVVNKPVIAPATPPSHASSAGVRRRPGSTVLECHRFSASNDVIWMASKGRSRMRNWGYPTNNRLIGFALLNATRSSPRTVAAGSTCIRCFIASHGAVKSDPATDAPAAQSVGCKAPVALSTSYVAMKSPVPGKVPMVSMKKPR